MKVLARLTINGLAYAVEVEPRRTLADAIRRDCGLTGTHIGCEHGVCGSCTVIVDGEAVRSCLMFAVQAEGCEIVTIEGLAGLAEHVLMPRSNSAADRSTNPTASWPDLTRPSTPDPAYAPASRPDRSGAGGRVRPGHDADFLHPLQHAFIEHHGLQCGFCTPGFLMLAAAVLHRDPQISDTDLIEALSSNLCRCTGYQGIIDAALAAARMMRASNSER